MNNVFVTATGQDKGKTTFTIGLLELLLEEIEDVGYMKPLGQRYVEIDGDKVDEDVELVDSVFELDADIKDMSPLIIDSGFTRENLGFQNTSALTGDVMDAYRRIGGDERPLLLEGAGKCSVGETFGLSNMKVAELTNSPVLLIAEGGIGRTIDECMLDLAYLNQFDIEIMGVVINKVYRPKLSEIAEVTGKGLTDRGLDVLGVIPYEPQLSAPTLSSVVEELEMESLTTRIPCRWNKPIRQVLVGAMKPHQALNYLEGGELLITGGDREDILIAVLCWSAMSNQDPSVSPVSGIIATGGIRPHSSVTEVAEELGIQMFLADDDTYSTAARVRDMTVKIKPEDDEKIGQLADLLRENIDLEKILQVMAG